MNYFTIWRCHILPQNNARKQIQNANDKNYSKVFFFENCKIANNPNKKITFNTINKNALKGKILEHN